MCVVPAIVIDVVNGVSRLDSALFLAVPADWFTLELSEPDLAPGMVGGVIFSGLFLCSHFYTTDRFWQIWHQFGTISMMMVLVYV